MEDGAEKPARLSGRMPDQRPKPDLPTLEVPLPPAEVIQRLDKASRRGRLPGFEKGNGEVLFRTDAWGTPFDSDLMARCESTGEVTRLGFSVRLRRKLPAIYVVILAVTVWPGVIVTDSMLRLWFEWYNHLTQIALFNVGGFSWFTYAWYLPLTVLPLPWMWKGWMRRSCGTAHVSALEMIAKMAGELGVAAPPEAAAVMSGESVAKGS